MRVVLVPSAERDLGRIADYISQDNPDRAASFVSEILDTCAGLSHFPERFPLTERPGAAAIRRCRHGRYLIFYRIEQDAVRVVHILHGASDYGPLLEGS